MTESGGNRAVQTHPGPGEAAPEFEAVGTRGTLRLSDFNGRRLVLFSHPPDSTPVCTTEFAAFTQVRLEPRKETQLSGMNVDSVSSHLAWICNIWERIGVRIPSSSGTV